MAKKLVFSILFFCLLPFFIGTAHGEEKFPFLAEVTSENLNVRAGQNVNFEKLCRLAKGSEVVIVGKSFDWYKIKLPKEAKSYVSQDFVSMVDDHTGQITGHRVNIRSGPGSSFSALGQLAEGTTVTVVQKANGWVQIEPVEGTYGWISSQLVKFKSTEVPQTPVVNVTPEPTKIVSASTTAETATTEKRNQEASAQSKAEALPIKISVTGKLVHFPDVVYSYKLIGQDGMEYYLGNTSSVFESFLDSQVSIEGMSRKSSGADLSAPSILDVQKIQWVL